MLRPFEYPQGGLAQDDMLPVTLWKKWRCKIRMLRSFECPQATLAQRDESESLVKKDSNASTGLSKTI